VDIVKSATRKGLIKRWSA